MARKRFFTGAVAALMIFSSCTNNGDHIQPIPADTGEAAQYIEDENQEIKIGDRLPVTRGLAVKMVSLAFADKQTLRANDREITYIDTDETLWYDKYINGAYILGLISPSPENAFYPEEALTLQQAQILIDSINPDSRTRIKIDEENENKAISYALWCQLFIQALEEAAGWETVEDYFGIEEISFVVLASAGNNSLIPEGIIITDKGPYSCEGIIGDYYIDMEVAALVKDGEILAVTSIVSEEPIIRNAYITDVSGGQITIFSGGAERSYLFDSNDASLIGRLCDIRISGNLCIGIHVIQETVEGKVLAVSDEVLELEGHPPYTVGENFKIYSTEDGSVKWRNIRSITVGGEGVKFFINNGIITGAVIQEPAKPDTIRVVIGNTGFTGLHHDRVELTATDNFTVTSNGESMVYPAGETIVFNTIEDINGRVFIETTESGRIELNSILRNEDVPQYRGHIEISSNGEGFIIVNEVDIEEYLYSVVPSEMPVSYGLEALKTQAVTARSFAYNQLYANKFHVFGGNVDDSVMSQVYNNIGENSISTQAVNETRGECLVYDGNVISANFFSTSAGVTANNGEVWADTDSKIFPTKSRNYLSSQKIYWGNDYGDLSVEENAAAFLKDWELEGYDSNISWFRWKTDMTNQQLSESINQNLKSRYEADPTLIKTLQPDGNFKSRPVETIGTLADIEVVERGEGGNIMALKITGTENTVIVYTEYNIRTLLRPMKYDSGEDIIIERKDGTQIANYALLPSGFFTMERMTDGEGNILYVRFYGGGNGHGVGMSQNAAKGMVDTGMQYHEVLQFFYEGTEIRQMY